MANDRRQQRRHGVVYGPPRGRESYSDNGVLIGRFLGLGILLLTLGALAAGALAFVGDRQGPVSTPGRSALIAASFSLLPRTLMPTLASTLASPNFAPTASPVPVIMPSLEPTIAPPLVQIGRGFITFGTEADAQLHIIDPRSTFALSERIVWSAYLPRPANSIDLLIRIVKVDGTAEGGERLITEEPVTPVVRGAQIFGRRLRPDALLDGPGIYVVRYVRGTDVLSQGSFLVTG